MDRRHSRYSQKELIHIAPLPQIVPSRTCVQCDVCCRFPEAESVLRPYFTREEIERAIDAGLDPASFPHPDGGQVRLVPSREGEGYVCPAFDPNTNLCGIYEARPLDCQIYPLALMWSEDGRHVVLGWDEKCPFVQDHLGARGGARGKSDGGERTREETPENLSPVGDRPALQRYAEEIAESLQQDETTRVLERNPRLIGPYQDDVRILRTLDRVSERLIRGREGSGVRGQGLGEESRCSPVPSPHASCLTPHDFRPTLRSLTLGDRARVEAALLASGPASLTDLAAYAFAPHMIWRALLPLSWAEIDDHLCLFAESADGTFMVLPPLGPGPLGGPLKEAFAYMEERNHGTAVSRVENVPEELRGAVADLGYRLREKDPDYLYRTKDLVSLAGDRYKSQRASCNQLSRRHRVAFRPYRSGDHDACVSLLGRWAAQKATAGLDPIAQSMLSDARIAHGEALVNHEALGLAGRVLVVDDAVAGYTFGYPRSRRTACVLLEVADRTIAGAAQVLFRECAREALAAGHDFINSMDASGLGSLAASKEHDHPMRLVPSYIATQA